MGDVIDMAGHRRQRAARSRSATPELHAPARAAVTFFFDLASPDTYLAAERASRIFGALRWAPVIGDALGAAGGAARPSGDALRAAAELRAQELRMPLVWPDAGPASCLAAMRIADHAAEAGRAEPFVLAAGRLAFCGGFDLDDPDVLAEAAGAAGLALDACLRAASDPARDVAMADRGRRLLAQGADRLPALRVGRLLFCGEEHMLEAAAASRTPAASRVSRDVPGTA